MILVAARGTIASRMRPDGAVPVAPSGAEVLAGTRALREAGSARTGQDVRPRVTGRRGRQHPRARRPVAGPRRQRPLHPRWSLRGEQGPLPPRTIVHTIVLTGLIWRRLPERHGCPGGARSSSTPRPDDEARVWGSRARAPGARRPRPWPRERPSGSRRCGHGRQVLPVVPEHQVAVAQRAAGQELDAVDGAHGRLRQDGHGCVGVHVRSRAALSAPPPCRASRPPRRGPAPLDSLLGEAGLALLSLRLGVQMADRAHARLPDVRPEHH